MPVHNGEREHATVAMHSEGNFDHGCQVVEEKQGWPILINTSYQHVHMLWSLKTQISVCMNIMYVYDSITVFGMCTNRNEDVHKLLSTTFI